MKIDNFMLSMHQTCPSKYNLRINEGWTTRRRSGALGFGAAMHAGLAEWYRTSGNIQAALVAIKDAWPVESPYDDYRTLAKAAEVMLAYAKTYPSENFKVVGLADAPIIEQAFTIDTGMYLSCQNKLCTALGHIVEPDAPTCFDCGQLREPIEYGGIFDGLIDFNGVLYVLEHKTTSQLGDYYFDQFKPNNQVSGYVWAASKLTGRKVGGALINAIGVYKSSATKFQRQITSRSDDSIAEWMRNVRAVCEEIQGHRRTGYWPQRTVACTLYGKCEFHQVHVLTSEAERKMLLEQDYIKQEWDFERRDG